MDEISIREEIHEWISDNNKYGDSSVLENRALIIMEEVIKLLDEK